MGIDHLCVRIDSQSPVKSRSDVFRPDWIGRTLIDAEGQRWHELDLAKLAAGSAFLMVGR